MREPSCFRRAPPPRLQRRGPAEPKVKVLAETNNRQLQGQLQHHLLLLGKAKLCPESLSVSALQVIQLEVLLRTWLHILCD